MIILALLAIGSALATAVAWKYRYFNFQVYDEEMPSLDNYPIVPVEVVKLPVEPSKIEIWAKAIAIEEGAKPGINNPGNLKYASLTASWGGVPGFNALDGGSICKFPTPEMGHQALCNFLTLAAENQLLYFHKSRTLGQFTQTYACPPPESHYAQNVAKALGVTVDTDISTFI